MSSDGDNKNKTDFFFLFSELAGLLVQSVPHQRASKMPRKVLHVSLPRLSTLCVWLRLSASLPWEDTGFQLTEIFFLHTRSSPMSHLDGAH